VSHDGVFGYCLHSEQGTHSATSLFQNSDFSQWDEPDKTEQRRAHKKVSGSGIAYHMTLQ